MRQYGLSHAGISGGVSANSLLRERFAELAAREGWQAHVPPPAYCTDNAAMIAMAGHFLLEHGMIAGPAVVPLARTMHR